MKWEDIKNKLAAPFDPKAVKWRVGQTSGSRGLALAYLDARDVRNRLDEVCGPLWQCDYPHVDPIIICRIGLYLQIFKSPIPDDDFSVHEWVWRADGAGETQFEAEKGGSSAAFKRAAVRWGIGEYLYHLPSPWVELEKNRIPKETQADLTNRLAAWQERYFK